MTFVARGSRALVGMIHLPPLPGSTTYAGQPFAQIVELAVRDAHALRGAGFLAGIIQNSHDLPFTATAQPETIAFLAAVGWEIRREMDWPLGVNILKNDAPGALAVAAAVGAAFVRLKVYVGAMLGAEGIITPSAEDALGLANASAAIPRSGRTCSIARASRWLHSRWSNSQNGPRSSVGRRQ